MPDVPVVDALGELDFDRDDAVVTALHDEVDLVLFGSRSQVLDRGLGGLREHAHAEGHQGLEEVTEERPVPGNRRPQRPSVEQRLDIGAEKPSGQCRIGR